VRCTIHGSASGTCASGASGASGARSGAYSAHAAAAATTPDIPDPVSSNAIAWFYGRSGPSFGSHGTCHGTAKGAWGAHVVAPARAAWTHWQAVVCKLEAPVFGDCRTGRWEGPLMA